MKQDNILTPPIEERLAIKEIMKTFKDIKLKLHMENIGSNKIALYYLLIQIKN